MVVISNDTVFLLVNTLLRDYRVKQAPRAPGLMDYFLNYTLNTTTSKSHLNTVNMATEQIRLIKKS